MAVAATGGTSQMSMPTTGMPVYISHYRHQSHAALEYKAFLDNFSLQALQSFYKDIDQSNRELEKNWEKLRAARHLNPTRLIYQIIHESGKPGQYTAAYSSTIAQLWSVTTFQAERTKRLNLQVSMMERELMLAITAAWTWLDVDIPAMAAAILKGQGKCIIY